MDAGAIQEEGGFSMGMSVKETYMADIMWWQIFKKPGGTTEGKPEGKPPREVQPVSLRAPQKTERIYLQAVKKPLLGRLALGAADHPTTTP